MAIRCEDCTLLTGSVRLPGVSVPDNAPIIGINAQILSTSQSYRAAGSSRYVFNLLRELRKMEPPECLVGYVGPGQQPQELHATNRFRLLASRLPTQRPLVRILWEQLILPRRAAQDGVTLLHGAMNALPIAWKSLAVVTILDLTFLHLPQAFNPSNRLYLTWAVRHAARRADRIITISQATRHDVIQLLGVPPERVVRIYCGVEERFGRLDDAQVKAFRAERGLPEEFILYLGTMEPRKNVIRLIQAYELLRQQKATSAPLVLAGGRGWGEATIFAAIESSPNSHDIRYVGYIPEDEMPLWYNSAAVFVYPSEYEGFGLPPLEALACGTPVVASNASSLPEVVGDAGILVDPRSPEAIAVGIQQVLQDAELRNELSQRAREQASRFTWQRMAMETLDTYRDVSGS
jgi:glycosyltransferase involved in cell wall biosynthesis